MSDKLIVHLIGRDKGVEVDLRGRSSREEWQDLERSAGRWSKAWVEANVQGTRTTYLRLNAITMAEVDYTAPVSPEVADKAAREDARATDRRRAGLDEERYRDKPSPD